VVVPLTVVGLASLALMGIAKHLELVLLLVGKLLAR
jgi:hypothetical protein